MIRAAAPTKSVEVNGCLNVAFAEEEDLANDVRSK